MRQRGFTLIEIIVGIVTLGIALVVLSTLLFPQAPRSAEPLIQARASALGQMFINEIMSKAFDQQSNLLGGGNPCESGSNNCSSIGPDAGETRANFNDVDDYHELVEPLDSILPTAAGRFRGFDYEISVQYSDNKGQPIAGQSNFKLITVTIKAPNQQDFVFSAIRGNY